MTLWMAWTALVTALLALAALVVDCAAARLGFPRRMVWSAALIVSVMLPLAIGVRVAPIVDAPRVVEAPSAGVAAPVAQTVSTTNSDVTSIASSFSVTDIVALGDAWLGRVWLAASAVWFGLLLRGVAQLRRRRAMWAEHGEFLVSRSDGPAVIGVIKPRIVVPEWALTTGRETRELLLLHEREHLRAHDSRVLFGAAVVLAAFPWNPALWWMSRRLRLAIEIDCDARVIRASGAAHSYGLMLVSVGERYAAPALPVSAALTEPGTHLEARIDAMTSPRPRRPFLAALPFVFAAGIVLTTAAWTPLPAPFRQSRPASSAAMLVQPTQAAPVIAAPVSARPRIRASNIMQPRVAIPVLAAAIVEAPVVTRADPTPLRGNPAPRYPDSLRAIGVEGHVLMKFSTNADGVPDTSTFQVVEATSPAFVESVRRVLARWRYDSQGVVRFAALFFGHADGSTYPAQPFSPVIDGISIKNPVVITALMPVPPRRDTLVQETPVRRQFDAWLAAFNNANPAVADAFHRKYALDPDKSAPALADFRNETGGFDLVSVRRVQPTSMEFVVHARAGVRENFVGYFAIAAADNPFITSLRILYVRPDRSVDDPELIDHLQKMRP